MKIMVFDIPADQGGALSILQDFYKEVSESKDMSVEWTFVVSTPILKETGNIHVLSFPWVKKSWVLRLYFDYFIAPRLVRQHHIDRIFSLQNVTIPHTSVPQVLYIHQPLPFTNHQFTFLDNRYFWTYQKIIGRRIKQSAARAAKVIVQTKWMKDAVLQMTPQIEQQVEIVSPDVQVSVNQFFTPSDQAFCTFFFPGGDLEYKNHRVIVEAAKLLKERGEDQFKIFFTLDEKQDYTLKFVKEAKEHKLPLYFLGKLSRKEVYTLYATSVLLFPSYIETFGLPLLEAKMHRGVILASDQSFSREILEGYQNAAFFDPFNALELADKMLKIITYGKQDYYVIEEEEAFIENHRSLADVVHMDRYLNIN